MGSIFSTHPSRPIIEPEAGNGLLWSWHSSFRSYNRNFAVQDWGIITKGKPRLVMFEPSSAQVQDGGSPTTSLLRVIEVAVCGSQRSAMILLDKLSKLESEAGFDAAAEWDALRSTGKLRKPLI